MRKLFFFSSIIVSVFIVTAFVAKKDKRPFSVTYWYNNGAPYQRVECVFCSPPRPIQARSIICDLGVSFRNASNWSTTPNHASPLYNGVDNDSYVNSITIDVLDNNSDGNDGDGVSLDEVLDALYKYYQVFGCAWQSSVCLQIDSDPLTPCVQITTDRTENSH